jgi:hypothetical protein
VVRGGRPACLCRSNPPEIDAALEAEIDEAIALCGGDARAALRATLVANAFLEAEVQRLSEVASAGLPGAGFAARRNAVVARTRLADGGSQMSVTYYVALPFIRTDDGIAAGQGQECPNGPTAIRRAEAMSRDAANVGALAFKRTGDPNIGAFDDATILRSFGVVPDNLDEL